jgi:hypothetical protein
MGLAYTAPCRWPAPPDGGSLLLIDWFSDSLFQPPQQGDVVFLNFHQTLFRQLLQAFCPVLNYLNP